VVGVIIESDVAVVVSLVEAIEAFAVVIIIVVGVVVTVGKIDTVSDAFFAQVTPHKMNANSKPPKRNQMRGISVANTAQNNKSGGAKPEVWARAIDDFKSIR